MRARYMMRERPIPEQYLDPEIPTTMIRAIIAIERLERRGANDGE